MKAKLLWMFSCALLLLACNSNEPSFKPNGTYGKGKFSVSPTQQVYFMLSNTVIRIEETNDKVETKVANLQNQYDCYYDDGVDNKHVIVDEPNHKVTVVDKFTYEAISQGEYRDIATEYFEKNGGRVLSAAEWKYLLSERPNATQLRSGASIKVSNSEMCSGLIFLPDECVVPSDITFYLDKKEWSFNVYTISEWQRLEALGAIFLPACKTYNDMGGQGIIGDYMSCDGRRLYINSILGNYVQGIMSTSCCRIVKDIK